VFLGINWFPFSLFPFLYGLGYKMLASRAQPVIDEDGRPIVVADIQKEPYCQYIFDVLYITVVVQLLSLLSRWAFAIYAVVPCFAAYKLFSLWSQYSKMASAGAQQQPAEGKPKRPKMKILRR
jgi:hypothetical protein